MTAGAESRPPFSGLFLVGPTASGKTAVAHALALRLGAWVLSADSMLVYRGLDIGTAKPDAAMRREVRYWGVDVADPGEAFSAGRFRPLALDAFREAEAAGRPLIVAGGTGLYLKALTHGLAPAPPPDPAARKRWERLLREEGAEGLRRALRAQSEAAFRGLADPDNPRRLIRALERLAAGGAGLPQTWHPPDAGPPMPGLLPPRPLLHRRIEERVRRMYAGGLLEEVRGLLDSGAWPARTAGQAIGYAEAAAAVRGETSVEEAMAATAAATRRLARRQLTWFRRQARVEWIEAGEDMGTEQLADAVRRIWDTHGPVPVLRE